MYESKSDIPFLLFGIPIHDPPYVKEKIGIPGFMKYLLGVSSNYRILGLKDVPRDDYPPLGIAFSSFHLMVYLGILMMVAAAAAVFFMILKRFWSFKFLLRLLVVFIPVPIVAAELGWMTTEVGRQPWLIYNVLRTKDAVSVSVSSGKVLFSLILIAVVDLVLLVLFVFLTVKSLRRDIGGASS